MNILITGADGFIGSHLSHHLFHKTRHQFRQYDLELGDDIRDKFKLNRVFTENQFDVVVHLAARTGVGNGQKFPEEYISTNITGTNNIIEMCQKYDVPLVFFSSSSVLGGGDRPTGLRESSPYNPLSVYGVTKVAGEMLVKASLLNYIIIRPFTVYGERGRKDMVLYRWIEQIKNGTPLTFYGDGTSSRGYTYVGDLVDGVMRAVNHLVDRKEEDVAETIHLGGAEVVSLNDLVKIFKEFLNKKKQTLEVQELPSVPEDVKNSHADISKAKFLLEWEPKGKFEKIVTNILKKEL